MKRKPRKINWMKPYGTIVGVPPCPRAFFEQNGFLFDRQGILVPRVSKEITIKNQKIAKKELEAMSTHEVFIYVQNACKIVMDLKTTKNQAIERYMELL